MGEGVIMQWGVVSGVVQWACKCVWVRARGLGVGWGTRWGWVGVLGKAGPRFGHGR